MVKLVTDITQIKILPDHLINQIAAGEVVERPASVVKELLDNSLDARATQVNIDIEQGGVGLIRIKDDGIGIPHDELGLALTRHATSKISQINDLHHLTTMGFRGEALPSIASISRLMINSKFIEEEHAWSIKSEGRMGTSLPEPTSHTQGTSIEVRDLFFNVPARRKYLRAERTEFYQIQQLVRHFAISHPELGVRLSHNGRQILNLKPAADDQTVRVQAINGTRFMQNAIKIEAESQELVLKGWAGKREAARTMNDSQFFCLNGRCIKDKRINHAIQQAYQGMLPEGRYATYALYLELEPSLVDINVHPAKTEVRFRDGRTVHDFIYGTLNRSLRESQIEISDFSEPVKFNNATVSQSTLSNLSTSKQLHPARPLQQNKVPVVKEQHSSYEVEAITQQSNKTLVKSDISSSNKVGDVLILNRSDELWLVDIKKAQQETCQAALMNELEEGCVRSKALLFPHTFPVDESTALLYKNNNKHLMELGIDIVESQLGLCQLRQLPVNYPIAQIDRFIVGLENVLGQGATVVKIDIIEMFALHYAETAQEFDEKMLLGQLENMEQDGIMQRLSEFDLLNIIKGTYKGISIHER